MAELRIQFMHRLGTLQITLCAFKSLKSAEMVDFALGTHCNRGSFRPTQKILCRVSGVITARIFKRFGPLDSGSEWLEHRGYTFSIV